MYVCVSVAPALTKEEMDAFMSVYDLKRLESYSRQQVDYHTVSDLVPPISRRYFVRRLPVHLSAAQSAIVLAMGLQMRTVDEIAVRVFCVLYLCVCVCVSFWFAVVSFCVPVFRLSMHSASCSCK